MTMELGFNPQIIDDFFRFILSKEDLQSYILIVKVFSPQAGQLISIKPGLYLVTKGTVQLLDESDKLIATLNPQDSFGEFTLFPHLKPYRAKASLNLQLAFIPEAVLSPLIKKYPKLQENLWQQSARLNAFCSGNNDPKNESSITI